jgi:hypothetical protein
MQRLHKIYILDTFLFRDTKQFTGPRDCQARSEQVLHSHFNASFAALNLISWHDGERAISRPKTDFIWQLELSISQCVID